MASSIGGGSGTGGKWSSQWYTLRVSADMRSKLQELADAETRRLGYPVPVSALVRKYVHEGMTRARQKKVD